MLDKSVKTNWSNYSIYTKRRKMYLLAILILFVFVLAYLLVFQVKGNLINYYSMSFHGFLWSSSTARSLLPLCKFSPNMLKGSIEVSANEPPLSITTITKNNPLVEFGGHYKPPQCRGQKIAIIIPYRNRETHLLYFLQFMHPILQRQQLEYKVYVINQSEKGLFNRGKLLNIGYKEAKKDFEFDCFVFHDVSMVLTTDAVMYTCSNKPRHLSEFPRTRRFDGVVQMKSSHIEKVNGFSNEIWKLKGSKENMVQRIFAGDMNIVQEPYYSDYNYFKFPNSKDEYPPSNRLSTRTKKLSSKINDSIDGLNTLKYKVLSNNKYMLFTAITVTTIT